MFVLLGALIVFATIGVIISSSTKTADIPLTIWGEECPDVTGVSNFDATSYTGQWFQLSALPLTFNIDDTCVWAKYTLLSNGNIAVNNSGIRPSTGKRSFATGEAAVVQNTSGELDVQFFKDPSPTADPNYIVLDTNYTEFTYVWNCNSTVSYHTPQLWIMNREYDRNTEYTLLQLEEALDILTDFGYDSGSVDKVRDNMGITDQENCDY